MTKLQVSSNGLYYLHLWRAGDFYDAQKGDRFRREWTSLRYSPYERGCDGVDTFHDMTRPLPFQSGTFHAVYVRRIIEHLTPEESDGFMKELHRVCLTGAVVRVSVPDFEEMCRAYVAACEEAWKTDDPTDLRRQEFAALELMDQMVRERPQGFLGPAIRGGQYQQAWVRERFGDVFETVLSGKSWNTPKGKTTFAKLFSTFRRRMLNALYGRDPRRNRETNRWMYDRVNARLLCERAGFVDAHPKAARDSDIPNWSRYDFDWSEIGNHEVEPSLYIECMKPAVDSNMKGSQVRMVKETWASTRDPAQTNGMVREHRTNRPPNSALPAGSQFNEE